MKSKMMKILIIEDDPKDCNNFKISANKRNDIEIIGMTDSDIEGLKILKAKRPEGIILDLELNNSATGNTDSLEFLSNIRELNLDYQPIIIVTTHVNSKRIYEILHKKGVDIILYKGQANYSSDYVLNRLVSLRDTSNDNMVIIPKNEEEDTRKKISGYIYEELDLIGVTSKLKGREYIHDAILYLIENENNSTSVIQYLTKVHKRSATTITNGIQNAIIHAWRITPVEDLMECYKARINYETGIPTPMELIYYYRDKIKKMI